MLCISIGLHAVMLTVASVCTRAETVTSDGGKILWNVNSSSIHSYFPPYVLPSALCQAQIPLPHITLCHAGVYLFAIMTEQSKTSGQSELVYKSESCKVLDSRETLQREYTNVKLEVKVLERCRSLYLSGGL